VSESSQSATSFKLLLAASQLSMDLLSPEAIVETQTPINSPSPINLITILTKRFVRDLALVQHKPWLSSIGLSNQASEIFH
jgi:uncharacterized protein (DUF2342 family)